MRGCPDYLRAKLTGMGIHVNAPEFYSYACQDREELLEYNRVMSLEKPLPELRSHVDQECINLDAYIVESLVSDILYSNGRNEYSVEKADLETHTVVKSKIEEQLKGKRLIMCQRALSKLNHIIGAVASEDEAKRCQEFMKNVQIVEDPPEELTSQLTFKKNSPTAQATENSYLKCLLSTGMYYNAKTLIASKPGLYYRTVNGADPKKKQIDIMACASYPQIPFAKAFRLDDDTTMDTD